MKRISVTIAVLLVLFAGYLWATPYFTIMAISNGLLDRNSQALSRHVDFPALRQGLKDQTNALFMKDAHPDSQKDALSSKNTFSSFGRMIGSQVIHAIIDSVVTPKGMIALAGEAAGHSERGELNSWWRRTFAPFVNTRYGYESFSMFSYWLRTDDGDIHFVLRRSGLQWRMTNALIPQDLLKRRFMKWIERK